MATEFKLPEVGENVTAGDVVRVLVSVGDTIERDQPVLELETDKATIEVPSSVAGTVKDVQVKQGDKVKVGQVVLTVEETGAAAKEPAGAEKAAEAPQETPESTEEEAVPVPEGAVEQHAHAPERKDTAGGAERARRDRAAEQQAREAEQQARKEEQAETEEPAPRARRGEVVDISRGARVQAPEPPTGPREVTPAAPSVRRLARELGIEIVEVPGSGPGGRISLEDVKAYARGLISGASTAASVTSARQASAPGIEAVEPLPDFGKWGGIERQPMSGIRRKTAEHLSHAWRTIPHVTQHDRADITALEQMRERFAPRVEKESGGKLTITAILVKVVAGALKRFAQFNASADASTDEIIYKQYINVGVAVDTERGLLVPVIRDVPSKGVAQIAAELAEAASKARDRKLSMEDMSGGTFTITNLGGIGGTYFSPIVNWPEVAILGVSRARIEPVHVEGTFHPRLMCPLSLSYDHRVIDGADAVRFLRWIVEALEEPFALAL